MSVYDCFGCEEIGKECSHCCTIREARERDKPMKLRKKLSNESPVKTPQSHGLYRKEVMAADGYMPGQD